MLRVLVVDDESLVLDMLAVSLRAPGVALTTCREVEAAEALIKVSRYDVLIADLSVSELGGLDGIRLIRFVRFTFSALMLAPRLLQPPRSLTRRR